MRTRKIRVIDSHTGGEPTRVVLAGGPSLGDGPLVARRARFSEEYDHFRSAIVNEPRGSDALVGALLSKPVDPSCAAGVIFFNNVGYLGMCGHGTIGLMVTLAHAGIIEPGTHRVETPAGIVKAELHPTGEVTLWNVPSYRYAAGISIELPAGHAVTGDIAWGGNWFFLTEESPVEITFANLDALTLYSWQIRQALAAQGFTGRDGATIDHIEISGEPGGGSGADSRNFVLCPGKSYDRSPCGTGTSAKLACLHASGKLRPHQIWRQESITGSVFEGSFSLRDGLVVPRIRGSAFITAEAELVLDACDPLQWGLGAAQPAVAFSD